MIDPASLGAVGRTVKCAKCGHKWYQEAPRQTSEEEKKLIEEAISEVKRTSASERRLPVRIKEKKNNMPPAIAAGVMAVVCFVTIFFAGYENISVKFPFTREIYAKAGFSSTLGLKLKDVKITRIPDNDNYTFLLQGSIENTSDYERQMPILKVNAINNAGDKLRDWEFTKKDATLSPKEAIPFQTQISLASPSLKYITLDIGNFFEISRREQ